MFATIRLQLNCFDKQVLEIYIACFELEFGGLTVINSFIDNAFLLKVLASYNRVV